MLCTQSVMRYRGPSLMRGPDFVYLPAHPQLAPFIANYTVTCPACGTMPEDYTVLPTASATLSYSIDFCGTAKGGLRGVNTVASVVGSHANQYATLLLIEFHPMGLFPLLGIPQSEILNDSFAFAQLDARLDREILEALDAHDDIAPLVMQLDRIFLSRLSDAALHPQLLSAVCRIHAEHGAIGSRALCGEVFVSERQLERVFKQCIGTGIKAYARIARVNHALRLLQTPRAGPMAAVAMGAGYYDQSHFIRDFQALCGTTPQTYLDRMSVFYNDTFKM